MGERSENNEEPRNKNHGTHQKQRVTGRPGLRERQAQKIEGGANNRGAAEKRERDAAQENDA